MRLAVLLALLTTLTARAHDGRTPVLTLDLHESAAWRAADLAVPSLEGFAVREAPAGLRVASGGELRLTADEPIPWGLLSSDRGDWLLRTSAKQEHRLRYRGRPGQRVHVFGSFNDWARGQLRLEEAVPGLFERTLLLPAGDHQYLLQVDDVEIRDPANPDSVGNGFGGWNSRRASSCPAAAPTPARSRATATAR